ncbi:MAG: hypothetical protein U5L11_00305 [Arhodomonas sp.]|nr:hypothetical protein [Arhodomonas sp.]
MEPLKAQNWKRMAAERLLATWSVVPDGELVDAYRRTHSTLPERLDAEEFRHMEVAVETDAEEAVLTTFESDWPGIREHIMGLPLVVRNPAMTGLGNWVRAPDGTPYCLNWNNWRHRAHRCRTPVAADRRIRACRSLGAVAERDGVQ